MAHKQADSRWRRKVKTEKPPIKRYRKKRCIKSLEPTESTDDEQLVEATSPGASTSTEHTEDGCSSGEISVADRPVEVNESSTESPVREPSPELADTPDLQIEDDERFYEDDAFTYEDFFECDTEEEKRASEDKNEPLYNNAPISIAESLTLIMTFATRHKLTGKALSDLITLISVHCPPDIQTECLQNLQKFKEFFDGSSSESFLLHKYCSVCYVSVENSDSVQTHCKSCAADLAKEGAISHFIEISIEAQLRSLFAKEGFEEELMFRFKRQKKMHDSIEDIYDGEVYQKLFQCNGPLSDPKNISLTWNTDGIPVFKSSKFSVWPFYCVVNELGYAQRTKRENMLFAGLWFGDSKPSMLTFLEPLVGTLNRLQEDGVDVKFAGAELPFSCKVFTIAGTCDLPAKAMVLNTVQFNGRFGCLKCEQPGQTVKTGEKGHVHAFPFQSDDPKGPPRTHNNFMKHAKEAFESDTVVKGVKGPTYLSRLKNYDLVLSTGIDYMHCVLLGVMRTLMFLWFSTEFSRCDFSMAKSVKEVDKRLNEIRPTFFTRFPRSVFSHRMFFKASEYRSMLLFFGPVVFRGILMDLYYNHFLLLSEAIFILLMDAITPAQVDHAERLLWNFCSQIHVLYGERYMTATMHLLVHVADGVRDLGPLWTHSCFHFEDKNGHLLRLIHGTQNIPIQMVNAVKILQNLPCVTQSIRLSSLTANFLAKMRGDSSFQINSMAKSVSMIGASFSISLTGDLLNLLQQIVGQQIPSCIVKAFNRAQIGKTLYTSKKYVKAKRRNNCTVFFNDGGQIKYGQIELLFLYNEKHLAVVNEFSVTGRNLLNDTQTGGTCFHIVSLMEMPVKRSAIALESILGKLMFIDLSSMPGIMFVAHFPNKLEQHF